MRLLWLCAAAAAAAEDFTSNAANLGTAAEPLTLFLVVRSKSTNVGLRDALRRTWLAPRPGLGYRFFADESGCCAAEAQDRGDVVVRHPAWTHRDFELV